MTVTLSKEDSLPVHSTRRVILLVASRIVVCQSASSSMMTVSRDEVDETLLLLLLQSEAMLVSPSDPLLLARSVPPMVPWSPVEEVARPREKSSEMSRFDFSHFSWILVFVSANVQVFETLSMKLPLLAPSITLMVIAGKAADLVVPAPWSAPSTESVAPGCVSPGR